MNKNDKILITGGSGLVGTALTKVLSNKGFCNLVSLSSGDCNLIEKNQVRDLFKRINPDYVFHLAAKIHGIGGNSKFQADVLYQNVMMNTNVVESSREHEVLKIVAMGSGCVYPDLGTEELFENQIWLGPPHISQAAYGHSKRLMFAHLEAVKEQYGTDFVFGISGNIYGPNDSFNIETGNVTPSLIHKFLLAHKNKTSVEIWGSGKAIRDFSHSEDIANALILSMTNLSGPVNIGSGHRHRIQDIVKVLSDIYDKEIEIIYDSSKPDGQLARYYNIDKLISADFKPKFDLNRGIYDTHNWLRENINSARI